MFFVTAQTVTNFSTAERRAINGRLALGFSLFLSVTLLILAPADLTLGSQGQFPMIFGSKQVDEPNLNYLPQWLKVLKRHPKEDFSQSSPKIAHWLRFLDGIKSSSRNTQIDAVNRYINKSPYVEDISNYGVDDYWAIVREFLQNFGDCEDYAISKYFSLRILGLPASILRIVIVQDTNLRVPHAVVAVNTDRGVLILDNQTTKVTPQNDIVHYQPLYSLNEHGWWLHLP